jgi:hypothetical protein
MKLITALLILISLLFNSSCGCSGYGGMVSESDYELERIHFIKLEDPKDTIILLKYTLLQDSIYNHKNLKVFEIPISNLVPTEIYVRTAKKEFNLTLFVNVTYEYFEDRYCRQNTAKVKFSRPTIQKIEGGTARFDGTSEIIGYTRYSYDTLVLK